MASMPVHVPALLDLKCLASPNRYKSDSRPRGYAVVVNTSQFISKTDRLGSEHDISRMKELFTDLHFTVLAYENLSAEDLYREMSDISKDNNLQSHDCFACVLMSHGGKGYICGADGRKVKLKKIYQKFSNLLCPALRRKPKLFFIQACSGGQTDYGVDEADSDSDYYGNAELSDDSDESDDGAILPTKSDMLVIKASTGGYKSYRNKDHGSRFLQSVGDVFEQRTNDLDVMEMLYKVTEHVQQKATHKTQCPIVTSTLCRKLYLCPDQ